MAIKSELVSKGEREREKKKRKAIKGKRNTLQKSVIEEYILKYCIV